MTATKFVPRLAGLAALLALLGCASASDRALRNSPDFKAGYSDGCASASAQGTNVRTDGLARDEAVYRSNRAYHAGWGTGFNACRSYQPGGNMPPPPGQGPVRDPYSRPF